MSKGQESTICLSMVLIEKTMKTIVQELKSYIVMYWTFLQYIEFYSYPECPQDTALHR